MRAAWVNRQDAEVGEHIGDLLASRRDSVGAAKMYELALATIPPYNAMGVKRDKPTAQEIKLREKLKANGGTVAKDSCGNRWMVRRRYRRCVRFLWGQGTGGAEWLNSSC